MNHALDSLLRRAAALAGAGLILCSMTVSAGDAALYGPEAPPGSAFIRVLNASSQPELSAQAGNTRFDEVAAWSVSEFEYLPAGPVRISAGSAGTDATLEAHHYYTAVVGDDGVHLLDNEGHDNRLKALIILYNLTDAGDLSLRTTDGSTTIVDAVDRGRYGTREVNAARAKLAVFAGDRSVAETQTMTLSRGKALSLFALGPSSAPRLVWSMN